jgi:uncharacterized protein (DUF1810 family)
MNMKPTKREHRMSHPQSLDQIRQEATISQRLWVKVLGMLQQNWCVLELNPSRSVDMVFFDDHGKVFDWLPTPDVQSAHEVLHANGFSWMWTCSSFYNASGMPNLPKPDARERNRPVYSSGEYWIEPTKPYLTEPDQSYITTTCPKNALKRFVEAQDLRWYSIIEEIATGRKQTHWIWFVFPQLRQLSSSRLANYFGLAEPLEAAKYWNDDILGDRLRSCVDVLLVLPPDTSAQTIFGNIDAMKLRSCMTLFENVSYADDNIVEILVRYFHGERCPLTLEIIKASEPARRMRISR